MRLESTLVRVTLGDMRQCTRNPPSILQPTPIRARLRSCATRAWIFAVCLAAGPIRVDAAQSWPILHHDIQATVEPGTNHLAVLDRVELATPEDRTQPLHVLLHAGLAVASVVLKDTGAGAPLRFEAEDRFQPRHFWERPNYEMLQDYAIAREVTVQAPAGGWPDTPNVTFDYAGVVYDSLRPPKVAYQRGFDTSTGLVDARGVYLEGSTFWIPWSGEGLFRFRLRARVPGGWESVSQGTWAERRTLADGQVESHWIADDPMPEAYLVAGPYVVRQAVHDSVQIYTFTYANTPDDLCRMYLAATGKYLQMYDEMIGPYPFDKFAMVENWWQTGYGMPSFTLLGDQVIRLPFIVHTSYGHEILHNWWGNGVYVDERQGNWSEGLTTYLADYTYKANESAAAARDDRASQLQGYLDYATAGNRDFALRRFTERSDPATQAVGYGKTMMVFHMARRLVGDAAFFAALRHFYKEYRFRHAGWDEIVRSFEVATGSPATPGTTPPQPDSYSESSDRKIPGIAAWFSQWIDRPGAPVLAVERVPDKEGIVIELSQQAPAYALTVPVHYEVNGALATRDVLLGLESVRVGLESGTRWVAVDPEMEIFRKLHRSEVPPALSHVLGADSTVVVIGARCAPDVAQALRTLASSWRHNRNQILVDEQGWTGAAGRSVWLFGPGARAERLFAETASFGAAPQRLHEAAQAQGHSLVACFRDPENAEIAWTVVLPVDAAVVPALGRKLPHYGRYSYLVFAGETNVDKGKWQVTTSPMRIEIEEGSR